MTEGPWPCDGFLKCSNGRFVKFVNMATSRDYKRKATCLIGAVLAKNIEMVKCLLRVKEIDVNKTDGGSRSMSPLLYAFQKEYLEIARVNSFFFFILTRNV